MGLEDLGVSKKAGHHLRGWQPHQGKDWRMGDQGKIWMRASHMPAQVYMPEFPNLTLLNRHLYPHFPDEKTEV